MGYGAPVAASNANHNQPTKMQKTITANGQKITASMLRKGSADEANGGHNISSVKGREIHWCETTDETINVFNAGSIRRGGRPFGAVIASLR